MKFITAYTIQCNKSSKDHMHHIAFLLYKKRRSYVVYYEEELNNKTVEFLEVASFFSERLARSFLNALFSSIDNNLEKFDITKLAIKQKRRKGNRK